MNDNAMRDSLLSQQSASSVALQMLHDMMEAEKRRVRLLTIWTWIAWSVWIVLVVLYVLLVVSAASQNAALREQGLDLHVQAANITAVDWPIWFLLVPLGVIAVILTIVLFVARRSATLSQLRGSVAAIDEQLKLLVAAQRPGPPAD
jgi:hypothetical protein